MFTKKHLIVVHGMGTHSTDSIGKQVSEALQTALRSYPSMNTRKIEDLVDIIPFAYDDVFEKFRQERAASSDTLLKEMGRLNVTAESLPGAIAEIAQVEIQLGGDTFFDTHWLDVLLYRFTMFNETIRLRLAGKIADSVAAVGGSNVHVLGHSLGTALVHDALAKSFGPDNAVDENGRAVNLNPVTHKLGGVHLVANVSRALQTFIKVGSSIVRPGKLGCVSTFFEYRHRLDPITRIRPFTPTDNGGWVTHDVFVADYALIEPSAVTQVNVHDLGHYLSIPEVHQVMFEMLFNFVPNQSERDVVEQAFFQTTLQGQAQALQAAFGHVGTDVNDGAILDLLSAWKQFKDFVVNLGGKFI
jgi:hypothetical protein